MFNPKICDFLIETCLIFLIVFTPLAYGAVEPWGIVIFELTAAFMALVWILKTLVNGKIEYIKNPINPLILLFIFYISLQLFFSLNTQYSILNTLPHSIYLWATKTELLKIISYGLIFFVTLNTVRTKKQIIRILSITIAMGFIMSVFYLMRYFGVKAPRCLINRDHFSAYLAMIIPIALGFLFVSSKTDTFSLDANEQRLTSEQRFLLFFSIITMGAALFFTMSRGGIFSFIGALFFIAILVLKRKSLRQKGRILSVVVLFIILTVAWLGATPIIERILHIKVEITPLYFNGRFHIWPATIKIIKEYPLFGTGLGTFRYIFTEHQPVEIISSFFTNAHSDILELISEVGIPVSLFVFGICCLVYVFLFRLFKTRHNPWVIGMSIGFFGSLASIFLHSFTDFNLHIPANAVLLAVILALFISILKAENHSPVVAHGRGIINYPAAVLAIGLLVIHTVAVVRPALADHYAKKKGTVPESKIGTVPAGDCPYFKSLLLKAINFDPTNAEYHYKLGRLYGKSKAYELQLTEYKSAVRLNPTNSQYHQSLAWAYGQLHDLLRYTNRLSADNYKQNTEKEFQTAIELEPNNPYRHRAFAIWLLSFQDKENIALGIKEYKTAIALKPDLAQEFSKKYPEYSKQ
jgi:O-antigen ligase